MSCLVTEPKSKSQLRAIFQVYCMRSRLSRPEPRFQRFQRHRGDGQHTVSREVAQVEPRGGNTSSVSHLGRDVVHLMIDDRRIEVQVEMFSQAAPRPTTAIETKPKNRKLAPVQGVCEDGMKNGGCRWRWS